MLDRLKEQLLSDGRMGEALSEFRLLYETAEEPAAFHAALAEGDIAAAADHHPLTADELHERIGDVMATGEVLADDYDVVLEHDRSDFINA